MFCSDVDKHITLVTFCQPPNFAKTKTALEHRRACVSSLESISIVERAETLIRGNNDTRIKDTDHSSKWSVLSSISKFYQ